jgi:hypothetical protein
VWTCGTVSEEHVSIEHCATLVRGVYCLNSTLPAKKPRLDSQLAPSCSFFRHMTSKHTTKHRYHLRPIGQNSQTCSTACLVVHAREELFTVTHLGSCGTPPLERRMPIRQSVKAMRAGITASRQHYVRSSGSHGAPSPARSASTGAKG